MRLRIAISAIGLTGALLVAAAAPSELTGRVRVVGRAAAAAVPTIVYADPLDTAPPHRPQRVKLVQRNKTFQPAVVAVPAGSIVDFTNDDLIFHNVFSLSPPQPFDLGLYRAGASKSRTFSEPAVFRVFCNIHPQMTAILLVLPTPYITETDAAGNYRLDLPAGRYRITAWSERSQPVSIDVEVGLAGVTAGGLTLDESKFVELPHKNKFGQDYSKESYNPLKDKKPQ